MTKLVETCMEVVIAWQTLSGKYSLLIGQLIIILSSDWFIFSILSSDWSASRQSLMILTVEVRVAGEDMQLVLVEYQVNTVLIGQ